MSPCDERRSPDRPVIASVHQLCGKPSRPAQQMDQNKKVSVAKNLFPKYDHCKSLLEFPAIFTSCLNSGDFGSLSKLIKSRTEKHCNIEIFGHKVDISTAVRVFELLDELHPDSVFKCRNHRRTGEEIDSAIYFNYTSSKSISQSLKNSVSDPAVLMLCPEPQSNPRSLVEYFSSKPAEDQVALLTQIYTAEELQVKGIALMSMQINSHTKKITQLVITCHFTDFTVVG